MQRVRRGLSVEPGEEGVVAWAALTLFLVEWASVAVSNASDTLFLKRVGVAYIPIVFLVNSLLLTATTFAAGRLTVRFPQRRVLTWSLLGLAAALLMLWMLVAASGPAIATTLVIVSKQIDVLALLMFWTIVGKMMTSRQGKRLVALMTAGGTLGTIVGSFSSSPLGKLFGIPSLLAVAAVAFVLAAAATVPLARSTRPHLYRRGAKAAPPEREQLPHLGTFWRESSLFRVLVCTSFLAGVLGPLLYYEFSSAADLATRGDDGEQKLLGLYGMLRGWINIGVLALQIGVSAELFRRIGVPLAATLSPAAYLAGFGGLAFRFGLPTAMPAAMGSSVLDHTIYEPAQRILAALLPLRMRTAATSVIQGPAKRAGAALGSLLILGIVQLSDDPATIALFGLPIAGLWMALAVSLWRNYPNLLLEAASVRHGDPAEEQTRVAFLDPGTMRMLRQNLESGDENLCRAACALFADAPPAVALEALTRAISKSPSQCRSTLIDTLERVLAETTPTPPMRGSAQMALPGGAARASTSAVVAYSVFNTLKNPPPDLSLTERATLLHVLGRASLGRALSAETRQLFEEACASPEPGLRVAGKTAAIRTGLMDAAAEQDWEQEVEQALSGIDEGARRVALVELRFELMRGDGSSPVWARRLELLATHLRARDCVVGSEGKAGDAERVAAGSAGSGDDAAVGAHPPGMHGCARAVGALADIASVNRDAAASCERLVMALADDPDPEVRSAVLRFIGNAGLAGHAWMLAERLSSRHAPEAAAARAGLENIGSAAADAMLHGLRHGGRRAREVLPTILRDIRADPAALASVIDREIEDSRKMLVALGVFDASQSSRLLMQRIRERVDESLRVALELLAINLDDDRIANVCRSLGRAWNVRDRAVLLEALEALLPPADRDRILPLLEDQGADRLAASAAHALGSRLPTLEEAVGHVLVARDPLTSALVAATMDSTLLSRAAPELDLRAALRVFTSGRRAAASADPPEPTVAEAVLEAARREAPMLNQVETMLHLRALDLFEGLTTRQLCELAGVVHEVSVPAGSHIVTEGEFDDRMFFIVRGKVRIVRGGQTVAELGPRDFFGEMSVFDGETRSATVSAIGPVTLLRLSRGDLFEVMEDQPAIGIGICQTLVRRVRKLLEERPGSED